MKSPISSTEAGSAQRVLDALAQLAELSAPGPGVSRLAYGEHDVASRDWFAARCDELRLSCEIDRFGNCFGFSAAAAEKPAVVFGSHLDSVPGGGAFDGALGVVAGFEVAGRLLADDPSLPLGVVAFACEESTRFGLGAVGSRLLMGDLTEADLDRVRDLDGDTLRAVLAAAGLAGNGDVEFTRERVAAYLELHVDQGTGVADGGAAVGIVPAIAGVIRTRIVWSGEASHSGAHARERRRDALLAAATFVTGADRLWSEAEQAGEQITLTIGHLVVRPNSSNTVPGEVEAVVDLRAPGRELLERTQAAIEALAAREERGVTARIERLGQIDPVPMDPALVADLTAAAGELGLSTAVTPSMAGHDAGVLGARMPAAMLFASNPTGVSHNPDEAVDPASLAAALDLMAVVARRAAVRPTDRQGSHA